MFFRAAAMAAALIVGGAGSCYGQGEKIVGAFGYRLGSVYDSGSAAGVMESGSSVIPEDGLVYISVHALEPNSLFKDYGLYIDYKTKKICKIFAFGKSDPGTDGAVTEKMIGLLTEKYGKPVNVSVGLIPVQSAKFIIGDRQISLSVMMSFPRDPIGVQIIYSDDELAAEAGREALAAKLEAMHLDGKGL